MKSRLVVGLLLAGATAAVADEARIASSTALAARVEVGSRSGLVVSTESSPSGTVVSVSHVVRPLAAPPRLPLADARRCGDPAALDRPTGLTLPPELATVGSNADDALEVLTAVVSYVGGRIRLEESDPGPQDALSVLRRGKARCSGRANLVIGWLRTLGIPARAVHGVLLGDEGPSWHRWGEAWLGDLGWVPFDPGASVGVVSVRHLPMRGASEGASLFGVSLLSLDERGYAALPRRDGLRVPPVGGATLRCVAPAADTTIAAQLLGPDGTRWARAGAGEVVFAGLLPGTYVLRWTPSRRGVGQVELRLDGVREVWLGSGEER
jgi:hypothetical protein